MTARIATFTGPWRSWTLTTALLLLFLPVGGGLAAEPSGQAAFDRGVAAFRDEDFEEALGAFLAARRAGEDTSALHYNLGATYYRLGRYDAARAEFRQLLDDAEAAPAAHYNLGLIAHRVGDADAARRHYREALGTASAPALQELARVALEALDTGTVPVIASRWQGLVSLAGGYDDNVTLAPQGDLLGVSGTGDSFVEMLAAARYQVSGEAKDGLRIDTGAYLREYLDVERFDQVAARLGMARARPIGKWDAAFGGHLDIIFLGGDHFENIYSGTAEGTRGFDGGGELRLWYRLSRIEAAAALDQLTGWLHRARAQGRWEQGAGDLYLGYELEWNDRNDLRRGADFFSLSPLRNILYAEAVFPLATRWELSVRGEYRHSRYRDANNTADGIATRRDEQSWFSLRIDHRLDGGGRLFAAYIYADNDSSIDAFGYSRNEYVAGMEWSF